MSHMKKFVIWGSSGHAKVLADVIYKIKGHVIATFDNDPKASSLNKEIPLYIGIKGFKKWLLSVDSPYEINGLIAIGSHPGIIRLEIMQLFFNSGLSLQPLISPSACIANDVFIGSGTQVLSHANIAADSKIGSACIINHFANVDHECIIKDAVHLAPRATLCGCVVVEEGAMIGAGAVVLPRVHIGKNALVGAGAVVTKNVEDNTIVIGNPAKPYIKSKLDLRKKFLVDCK